MLNELHMTNHSTYHLMIHHSQHLSLRTSPPNKSTHAERHFGGHSVVGTPPTYTSVESSRAQEYAGRASGYRLPRLIPGLTRRRRQVR